LPRYARDKGAHARRHHGGRGHLPALGRGRGEAWDGESGPSRSSWRWTRSEILPEAASGAPDCIIATGRSDYRTRSTTRCFPIFRGALDVGATTINEAMKLACVKAIAELPARGLDGGARPMAARRSRSGPSLIPQPFDPRPGPLAIVAGRDGAGRGHAPIADSPRIARAHHLVFRTASS
jgi:malate dehydrogenase (oxaloacetate-decarboxylating)(NADP+)